MNTYWFWCYRCSHMIMDIWQFSCLYNSLWNCIGSNHCIHQNIFSFWHQYLFSAAVDDIYTSATDAVASAFRDPQLTFIIEALNRAEASTPPVILHDLELDLHGQLADSANSELSKSFDTKSLLCSSFFGTSTNITAFSSIEEVWFTHIRPQWVCL